MPLCNFSAAPPTSMLGWANILQNGKTPIRSVSLLIAFAIDRDRFALLTVSSALDSSLVNGHRELAALLNAMEFSSQSDANNAALQFSAKLADVDPNEFALGQQNDAASLLAYVGPLLASPRCCGWWCARFFSFGPGGAVHAVPNRLHSRHQSFVRGGTRLRNSPSVRHATQSRPCHVGHCPVLSRLRYLLQHAVSLHNAVPRSRKYDALLCVRVCARVFNVWSARSCVLRSAGAFAR